MGQGPAVPTSGAPPLGDAPDRGILDVEFFSRVTCEGTYKQHGAAIQYYRKVCEHANLETLSFSNERMAVVAAIVHPLGPSFRFVDEDKRLWSWCMMVAQMDEESIKYVVEDGDRSRGLVGCEMRKREGSYDHSRQVQLPRDHPQLRDWDFILKRNDGTAVRLHPQWSEKTIPTFALESAEEIPLPRNGLGQSDGPGTFKRYKMMGVERTLNFR